MAMLFFDSLSTLPCYFRDNRAGSQLKITYCIVDPLQSIGSSLLYELPKGFFPCQVSKFLAGIQLYELQSVSHAGCHNFSLVTCEDEVIKQNHLRISPINSDNQ